MKTKKSIRVGFFKSVIVCTMGILFSSYLSFAQTPSLQQRLYYTCKVYGFVKYFHSNISNCNVNWDSVLVSILPIVESATTDSAFNDALDTMLAAAGPMALSTTYFPDTLAPELKRNRDFTWIDTSSVFRSDVRIQLDTIKNNFRPHTECWVVNNYGAGTIGYTGGWLAFPYDSVELNINTYTDFPDSNNRLLMFFNYWNIVRYFYPYNYVLDTPIDKTLNDYALKIYNENTTQSLYYDYLKIATRLNDAHVYDLTYSGYIYTPPNGGYQPYIRLEYVDGEYVVGKSMETGIYPGDVLISVDGLTTTQWEDSLINYYSSGNMSVFRRSVCQDILNHYYGDIASLIIKDSTGTAHTHNISCTAYPDTFFYNYYYPADSLDNISWTTMPCGIGYINIGNISIAGVDAAYSALQNAPAIIVDIRNYPVTNSVFEMAGLMYASPTVFSKLTEPDVTYPGTFFWYYDSLGTPGNPTPYNGKVIVLVNEETQSSAEFSAMILKAIPGAIIVGSQTAGADGNITYWKLSEDLHTGFTNLGVFYPNGDSTQRIGIVPDSVVYPTVAGIRHGNDEVLNKALSIAGCNLYAQNLATAKPTIILAPNPTSNVVIVEINNTQDQSAVISILDNTGRILFNKTVENNSNVISTSFNVEKLPAAMYFVTVKTSQGNQYFKKLIKE